MRTAAAILLAAALAALPASAWAKDLGVRGATWPVAEPDLLEEIEARLLEMEGSGALARLEAEARERARRTLEEPPPVPGIAPAREERSRPFDPAITVERDISTADGVLIAAAGTRVNPLERMTLGRDLLFVDGRREAEIAWALAHDRPAKIVLLAGRPLDLARRHRRHFFFDQGGRIAARLGLRFTPSLVAQDGSRLRITEIPVGGPGDCRHGREGLNDAEHEPGDAGGPCRTRSRAPATCRTARRPRPSRWPPPSGGRTARASRRRPRSGTGSSCTGSAVEIVGKMLRKGDRVLVEGRIVTREYRDREDIARTVTEIVVAGRQGVVNVLSERRGDAGG